MVTTELTQKLVKGVEIFTRLREEDIQVVVTPKEEVYREDKVLLYHFSPKVEHSLNIPILIVYALVNRPYIVDLQEGRSLVANLLELGLDVYLIDWGHPSRGDRWLTLDNYINGYINNCVDVVRDRHNLEQINLLGICQGGNLQPLLQFPLPRKGKKPDYYGHPRRFSHQ